VGLPGHGVDNGGHIGHGEPVGRCGEGQHGGWGGADPGLVHIDAADPAGAQLRGQRQLIQRAVGKPISTQSSAVQNRLRMPASRATIWGSAPGPGCSPAARVLWVIVSNRRTLAPLA
jgi:hypothetical protein